MNARKLGLFITLLCSLSVNSGCSDPVDADTGNDSATDTGSTGDTADENAADAEHGDSGSNAGPRRVLLLIADDLGVDQVLAYGDKDGDGKADDGRAYPPMPTVNGICAVGMRFDNAWSAPTCSPTRATIITGRYGFRTGVGWAVAKKNQLKLDEITLPELLSAKGVATANVGKWHLGTNADIGGDDAPRKAGWQHFSGLTGGVLDDYSKWPRTVDGKTAETTSYATTANVDDGLAWVKKRKKDEPWLLWVAFNAPHSPFHKPPNDLHDSDGLPATTGHIKKNSVLYYNAMVQALDTEIARLLEGLKADDQTPTDIIFIGDNGSPAQVATAPWDPDKAKGTLYEGGVRVPYCISGQSTAGKSSTTALVHTADLFATIVGMFGVDMGTAGQDSLDLAPLLKDGKAAWRDFNYTDSFGNPKGSDDAEGKAITDGTYKLIRFTSSTELFFNIATDRHETKDLKAAGLSGDSKKAYDALITKLGELK